MNLNIKAPASKSVSHRAVLAASLAPGTSTINNILSSQDIARTLDCLQALGLEIQRQEGRVMVKGPLPGNHASPTKPLELSVGESGTTCRLITPLAALSSLPCKITGNGRISLRPMHQLAQALQKQGAHFTWLSQTGFPPFILQSQGLSGGKITISLDESSQFLSALLMAAPAARKDTFIHLQGDKILSRPYIALTLQTMQDFGISPAIYRKKNGEWEKTAPSAIDMLEPGKTYFHIQPGRYLPREYTVEGDWSNASYFLAAGLLLPNGLSISGLDLLSAQGDRVILAILKQMGGHLQYKDEAVQVFPAPLQGLEIDMSSSPDLVPTVAVLCSLATGRSIIKNVGQLRLKESDRLQALAQEIGKTGCRIEDISDGLIIDPAKKMRDREIRFSTYGDHRLAMSLSLYELAGIQVSLDDPECVHKSFPAFWKLWDKVRSACY